MAEVIGLVASVGGLIQITGTVATFCSGYISSAKSASQDIVRLSSELAALAEVLKTVKQHVGTSATNPQAVVLSALETPLKLCLDEINDLGWKVSPKARRRLRGFLRSCTWPLKEKETSLAISQIERHKTLFTLALTANQYVLSKAIEDFSRNTNLTVSGLVETLLKLLAAQEAKRKIEIEWHTSEERTKVLTWLYSRPFDQKHLEISGKRQEHTGEWLLLDPKFEKWLEDNSELMYLCGYGIPGAGKTFLSSLVIDSLENHISTSNCGLAHVYFNYKEQDEQTPAQVVGSLIKQLAARTTTPALPENVLALYNECNQKERTPTLQELEKILVGTLKLFPRVFLVFDALDECDEIKQRKELLPLFHRLVQNGSSIFVTSRPYSRDIDNALSPPAPTCAFEKIKLEAKEKDITIYVEKQISESSHARTLIKEKFKDEIVSTLVKCCDGMFLLVHFYIEDLCQYTNLKQLQEALQNLKLSLRKPHPLHEIYDRAMVKIRGQHESRAKLTHRVLLWLVKARRTLTIEEVRTAVAVEEGMCELGEADMTEAAMLLEVCGGLAIIDENTNTIKLAHYSVHEYLESTSATQEPEVELVEACIHYLSLKVFSNPCLSKERATDRATTNPLFKYAAEFLHSHIQVSNEARSAATVLQFLRSPYAISYVEAVNYLGFSPFEILFLPKDKYSSKFSPLYEASRFGHRTVVLQLLDDGADVLQRDGWGNTALHISVATGQLELARLLLKAGTDVDIQGLDRYTPLHFAATGGYLDVVQMLLETGANTEAPSMYGGTPLHRASIYGRVDVVRLLLQSGANIEASSGRNEETPLYFAVRSNNVDVVHLLLQSGANIKGSRSKRGTPLHYVAAFAGVDQGRLLLQSGANIEAPDKYGATPLCWGVTFNNVDVVHLLLQSGANTEASDSNGCTSLHRAAEYNKVDMLRLLLQSGANTEASNSDGSAPLHLAASRGNLDMIVLLVEKGCNIKARNNCGKTPIHEAVIKAKWSAIDLLCDKGVDVLAVDGDGKTALHIALDKSDHNSAQILLRLQGVAAEWEPTVLDNNPNALTPDGPR